MYNKAFGSHAMSQTAIIIGAPSGFGETVSLSQLRRRVRRDGTERVSAKSVE
jgi:ATP/maltotriose-dependent transcriptional regulator MalT